MRASIYCRSCFILNLSFFSGHSFFDLCLCHFIFLINLLSSFLLSGNSPFEYLFKKLPDYVHLRTFGCACYPLPKPYNSLKTKTYQCLFLGYPLEYRGYLCYDMRNDKIYTPRHAFYKPIFPFSSSSSSSSLSPSSSSSYHTKCISC